MTISGILLHPGNRLLQGGTADFAMFGGQPATVSIEPVAATFGGYVSAFSAGGSPGRAAPGHSTDGQAPLLYSPERPDVAAGDIAPSSLLSSTAPAPSAAPPAPQSSGGLAPAPAAVGSHGAVIPPEAFHSAALSEQAPASSNLVANAFHAPVLDSVAPTFAPGAFGLTPVLSGTVLTPVVSLTDAVTAGAITTTLGGVADTLNAVGEVGATATADLANAVGSAESVLVTEVTGVGNALADEVHDSVSATVLPLVDHLAGTGDPVGDGVGDILGGTDPAAGIATLTAMVGSSDVFEIAEGTVGSTIDTAASALDAVPVDAEAAAPLLGDEHGLDGLSHHDDDGIIGIGGL